MAAEVKGMKSRECIHIAVLVARKATGRWVGGDGRCEQGGKGGGTVARSKRRRGEDSSCGWKIGRD